MKIAVSDDNQIINILIMFLKFKFLTLFKIKAMEINWIIIGIVAVFVVVLIVFTIRKNQKEKKKLTDLLNNDFKKAEEDEPDFDNNAS
ncbi:hypothetical protein [Flavobacterium piscis]|uniref:Cytoskeletal protein RodZ n=1 Tax=Flavobacterium piscis TaxID=1114874 RepID=A0ABU1Y653_9FLAO|nr:hypothetical protein [Flavobacterium piscis]MDR7209707.1 cytoskeletal protein RodZ [Flavobacterium piscis]